jgi:hypothetical protein
MSEMISYLQEMTNQSERFCRTLLERASMKERYVLISFLCTDWNLDDALSLFYEQGETPSDPIKPSATTSIPLHKPVLSTPEACFSS